MCGIAGFYSTTSTIHKEYLDAAAKALIHRGPDGQKSWLSSSGNVGLSHARLSIIDLATGDQPLHDSENQIHMVVNGELYDFERIRTDLIKRGHTFKTKSDSEIALCLYKEFGLDFVHHLRGEFALLLWDEEKQRFIALRDRFGIKPLFYSNKNNSLYFGSEAKALFSMGVPASWDEESLYHNTHLPGCMPDRTLFHDVYPLPAGCMLVATPNGMKIERYWDFSFNREEEQALLRRKDSEYIEEFRALLEESVRFRMIADVPVACYLSGGLDSSAVTGIAQLYSGHPIHAFTLSFEEKNYDEGPIAMETCEKIGAQFTPVSVSAQALVDNFKDAVWHAETLAINAHVSAKFLLSDIVRKAGYKVVLTGEGSDEILGGYAHFRQDMILHSLKHEPPSVIEAKLAELAEKNPVSAGMLLPAQRRTTLPVHQLLGYTPAWMESFILTGEFGKELLLQETNKYANTDVYSELVKKFDIKDKLNGVHPINQSSYLWAKSVMQNYILALLGDRLEMAHSIEGRVPFLDHKLVEFSMKLPVDLKIRNLTEKYILREAAKDVLTETVYKRNKHPFISAPAVAKSNKKFYDFIQDTLRSETVKRIPLYDHKKIARSLDQISTLSYEKQSLYDSHLLMLTSICALTEKMNL